MRQNFNLALEKLLVHEGGYVNDPQDRGGATNKGITIATFRRYIKRNGTVADLKALTLEQTRTVYKKKYWDRVRGDDLPPGLDYSVFDFAVNSGPSRSVKFLQRQVGEKPDGLIGPKTLSAVRKRNLVRLIKDFNDTRQIWLEGLRSFKRFGRGWTRRVSEVRETSLAMINTASPRDLPAPPPSKNTTWWTLLIILIKEAMTWLGQRK